MSEYLRKRPNKGPGCLGWFFGFLNILRRNPTISQSETVKHSPLERKPVYPTPEYPYQYTHPEQVPGQPEYKVKPGGKVQRTNGTTDLRG